MNTGITKAVMQIFVNNKDKAFCIHQIMEILNDTHPAQMSNVAGIISSLENRNAIRKDNKIKCSEWEANHCTWTYLGDVKISQRKALHAAKKSSLFKRLAELEIRMKEAEIQILALRSEVGI
jgi:hypothetical protein